MYYQPITFLLYYLQTAKEDRKKTVTYNLKLSTVYYNLNFGTAISLIDQSALVIISQQYFDLIGDHENFNNMP